MKKGIACWCSNSTQEGVFHCNYGYDSDSLEVWAAAEPPATNCKHNRLSLYNRYWLISVKSEYCENINNKKAKKNITN